MESQDEPGRGVMGGPGWDEQRGATGSRSRDPVPPRMPYRTVNCFEPAGVPSSITATV